MGNVVQFATVAKNPSMGRTAGTFPAALNWALKATLKIAVDGNVHPISVQSAVAGERAFIFSDGAGNLSFAKEPIFETRSIYTGGSTLWYDVTIVLWTFGMLCSSRVHGGTWTNHTNMFGGGEPSWTPTQIHLNNEIGSTDNGTVRFAALEWFGTYLVGGATNENEAQAYLQQLCNSRAPSGDPNSYFYNPFNNAASVNVDTSPLAQNWSLIGTPTNVANDDPFGDFNAALLGSN